MHVIPCALDRVPAGAKQGLMAGFYGSILPAVWSFQLALRSRGLGSAWTTLHLEYEDEAADLLGIPRTVSQVALLPVAYYTGDDFKPGTRRPAVGGHLLQRMEAAGVGEIGSVAHLRCGGSGGRVLARRRVGVVRWCGWWRRGR